MIPDVPSTRGLRESLDQLATAWQEIGLESGLLARLQDLLTGQAPPSERMANVPASGPLGELIDFIQQCSLALKCLPSSAPGGAEWGQQRSELEELLGQMEAEAGRSWRASLRDRVRGLYVIVDPEVTGGRETVEIGAAALRGGARVLQLRDKMRDKAQVLSLARELEKLCFRQNALLIVNDHADVARLSNAHGLHVGQGDLPVPDARELLAPWQLLGRSNPSPQHAVDSEAQGVDHVAIGSIYPTGTKATGRPPVGLEPLREVKKAANVPVVAIGGINQENVAAVVEAGADAVCVTSAVGLASDPEAAARHLVEVMSAAGAKV